MCVMRVCVLYNAAMYMYINMFICFRFIDAKSRPSLVEKIFLTVGMLCFFAMGKYFEGRECKLQKNNISGLFFGQLTQFKCLLK